MVYVHPACYVGQHRDHYVEPSALSHPKLNGGEVLRKKNLD